MHPEKGPLVIGMRLGNDLAPWTWIVSLGMTSSSRRSGEQLIIRRRIWGCSPSRFGTPANAPFSIRAGSPRCRFRLSRTVPQPLLISSTASPNISKPFEREMCSENISEIIQNNLVAPKSKADQIQ
jgi:hypothetical protein